jgi:intracellular multiplication protein IcmK
MQSHFIKLIGLGLIVLQWTTLCNAADQEKAAPAQAQQVAPAQAQQAAPAQAQPPTNQFQQWLEKNGFAAQGANQNPQTNANENTAATTHAVPKGRAPITYEEGQAIMRKSTPTSLTPPPPDSNIAFNMMMQQNMPLSPEQVVTLRQQIDTAQRAAAIPANIPPKPVSTTLMVNLAPGTTPPAVRLSQGYVSALVFVDSAGSPWPIASFDIGNPKALNVQWDGKSNIVLLQAIAAYTNGDIVVRLAGLPTPVTLELVSGQRVVDYRVDIHVSGFGPNTKELPMGTPLPHSANQLLLSVLDGVAPSGSRPLTIAGADAQAWLLGETMYLRTRFTLLSPGWKGKMVSPDGMQAYELSKTSTVLISRYGEPAELRIEGF